MKKISTLLFIISISLSQSFGQATWLTMATGLGSSAESVKAIVGHPSSPYDVYAGGTFTGSINYLAKWDGTSWQELGTGVNGPVYALVLKNNELYVAGAFTLAGGVAVHNIAKWSGGVWSDVDGGFNDKIVQAIFSPNYTGINFVLFSIADGFVYFNGNKRLYKTRSDLTQTVNEVINESDTITDAVITSDRSSLIFSVGTNLMVLNTRTDQVLQEFRTGVSKIEKIALVKDTLLATWSRDGTIFFWHYSLGQINPTPLFFLKAGNPTTMSFSDDGKLMSSGNIGNWARIWEPMDRKIIQELFSHTATVTSTCFGYDDESIFTGSLDNKIILWKKGAPPPPVVEPEKKIDSIPEVAKEVPPAPPVKDVVMGETNIPKIISGRKVLSDQKIETNSPDITIYVYDNSTIDGDTMSLFFNGEWILDHYGVTKSKQPIHLNLAPNTNNYLVLFANNLGKSPPNTAAIEFDDGKSKRIFKLSSDLKSCSAINFFYKK